MSALKFTAALAILLSTTACGDTWGQRAVTGGAIGAGSGAVIGSATGIGILPGALVAVRSAPASVPRPRRSADLLAAGPVIGLAACGDRHVTTVRREAPRKS